MKTRTKLLSLWVGLLCVGNSYGQYLEVDLSTGMDASGNPIGYSIGDDTWTVYTPGGSVGAPKVCTAAGGQWGTGSCSRWVSPTTVGNDPSSSTAGTFVYKMTFRGPYNPCGTAKMMLNFTYIGADNLVGPFKLNGNTLPLGLPTASGNNYQPLTYALSYSLPVSWLLSGWNTVEISVSNGAGTVTGLNICGKLVITPYTQLDPQLSGPNTVCQGNPLTFSGSLAPGSGAATGYFWEIQECDAAGNLTPGGFISGNWFIGSPNGNYTFPNNPAMTCGKYYRVKLAAVNDCTDWSEETKVIYYACPVIPAAPATVSICEGDCALIGVKSGLFTGFTYSWTYTQGGITHNLGTQSRISVCPTVSTTYTLTITNAYGCSASQTYTVNVTPNNPAFTLVEFPINSTLYTLKADAVDLNAFANPGFLFEWIVEELDGSGNPYYAHLGYALPLGNNCWWTYPSQTFAGFGVPTPVTGTYSQAGSCLPASGNFVYGRTYRLTRATWHNTCPRRQYSLIVAPTYHRGGDGSPQLAIYEDVNAPDFSHLKDTWIQRQGAATPEKVPFEVYPNPSTGIFTVTTEMPDAVLDIFDVLGKKVESFALNGNTNTYQIDLTGFAKGVYVIHITSGNTKQSKKVVLE